MKKINKKKIVMLIILTLMIIIEIKVFINSRANNLLEITAGIVDSRGILSDETCSLKAINEGDNGVAITLPEIINTKKISKYIITKKEIIETDIETPENEITENETPENETTTENTNATENEVTTEENTTTTVDMLPGEKIYLTQEEIENLEITLIVEYDTTEVNSQILYNKRLIVKDGEDYEVLSVSGYMPYDTEIETNEIDISSLENEILEKYPNCFLIGNYDINLTLNGEEYIAKDYEQTLNVEITINDETKKHCVLEVQDHEIYELEEFEINNSKVKFSVDELIPYLVLEVDGSTTYAEEDVESGEEDEITDGDQITPTIDGTAISVDGSNAKLEIDDYESDKNYYLGLNYTERMSKTNSGKYTKSNLKEVTVNYYGYDYEITEFVEQEIHDITLSATASRSETGTVRQSGNGQNRRYTRTDTISCTVRGIRALQEQYPGFNAGSSWTMKMVVPNNNFSSYFSADNTDTANSSNGISVSVSDGIITVTGADSSALEGDSDTWTFTFSVSFSSNSNNNINNTTYNTFTVNSFGTTISIGDYTPYGTISDIELQTLVSYRKCVPVDSNGNISLELIDNPFMNRPLQRGFNGWKTNDRAYSSSISTNTNTFVQTLSTNINNIIDDSGNYVINLYPDWVEANVIFVSSSGSSSNSGTSPDSPINNNWTNINTKINANIKTCLNASNREVNIIVLMNGTLDVSGLTGPSTAYTLTSLYDSTNYGSTSTYLNIETTNTQLDSDLQLNHIYVYTQQSYSSPGNTTTDGTSTLSPCLYGNMYNLRIGRGVVPTNSSYCTWSQVQGGYYNNSRSEYRLLLESGQYYTVQLYRASGGTNSTTTTTANATIVIGNDIDRINNNNESVKIYNRMSAKTTSGTANPYSGGRVVNTIIKSGTIGVDYFKVAGTGDSSERNYAGIYVGGHGSTGYDKGDRYLLVEGGNIANIIGGLHMDEDDMFKTYMYVKGGNVINMTGGAGYTHTYGDRIIQVTGGYVKYSISGGSNGVAASSSSNNGQLTGESLIYVGGTAQIGASSEIDENGNERVTVTNTNEVLYGVNAGCVCGGANGNSNYAGQTDSSYIIVDGEAIVHNNVFGGGNYGVIGASDTIQGAEVIEFNNETSNFSANTEYFIATSAKGGNGLSASSTSLANEVLSTSLIPSEISKWIFENASGNEYYIKNASTGLYVHVEGTSSSWGTNTVTLELSSTEKTAFTVEGTNTKTITYSYTTSGWWSQNVTAYLRYNNGWVMTNSTTNSALYLLTYELLPEEEVTEDGNTLVNIKVFGGTVKNNIYGGANQNNIYGTTDIDMDNGTVNGTIYGGSNILGTISGSALINISGGQLGTASENEGFDYTSVDVVFGGGLGEDTNVKGRTLLNIKDTNNNVKIYGNVYGGSSLGTITGNVKINIQDIPSTANTVSIIGHVFGGGKGNSTTAATVGGNVTANVDGSDLYNCSVFGGSNINGNINGIITVNVGKTYKSTLYAVYGGGNQASITIATPGVYVYLLTNADVTNAFNGGKAADLISSGEEDITRAIYLQGGKVKNLYGGSDSSGTVTVSHIYVENGNATNVYGGNNQGGITTTSNIIVNGGVVKTIYGGGDQAETDETNVYINGGEITKNVFGGGNQAAVNTNTNVNLNNATIGDNVYGGGNEGIVLGNTYVKVKDSTLLNSIYAGGNGSLAVVYGNTNIVMEGKSNNVTNNVFGGGNKAETGDSEANSSVSTVNIVGATIGKNVYGGANTSVVYGTTQTNIGYNTVNDTSLEIGDIRIGGTVFGGGEANEAGSEIYDFSFISVTQGIDIQIDGKEHKNFGIKGSIFGSGNASSTSGESYINIQNYGTSDNPQSNISIQRANCVTISNSAISLSGATDRTNEYSGTFFSISRVDQVKLKNGSILYLCNGANLLKELYSLVDVDGEEVKGIVEIDEETGETKEKNVDNRIYMLEGKNLNIATNEQATAYGKVQGMFFFGLFTNKNNPNLSTGLYHNSYENGEEITNAGTFISNSYVKAQHMSEHDITVDGFYTNYNEEGIVKVNYIDTTPKDDVYYIWLVGEKLDVTVFDNIELIASKFATLGTYELALDGFSNPNIKFSLIGFSSGLANGISLVEPNEIESIEANEDRANSVYGLTMKTGNSGWKKSGSTTFLTENGGKYEGASSYASDNSTFTPKLNFYFYHSQNITLKQALGDITIRLQVTTPIDDLNDKISYIDIILTLSSVLIQEEYYEGAITPGQEYGLFATTETNITNKSVFSTYYSLLINNFSENEHYENYKTYKRVLVSRDSNNMPYVLPKNTKLTMLDMATNNYYYYIVTTQDVENNKYEYYLEDFISMGSNDKKFNEVSSNEEYYNTDLDLIYENFIFHINFADTDITENIYNSSILIELRDKEDESHITVWGNSRDTLKYTVYCEEEATIEVTGESSPETLYLGNKLDLNVTTNFTQSVIDSKTIYDTHYFDKKLGIKISIYDSNGNRLNNDSLLGVNFELDRKLYYPRIDGTTRINIADNVTDVLAKIKMNTQDNTTLATGDYKIRIESFGSSDGIYYGLNASDMVELDLRIINSSYGLKVRTGDKFKFVDKDKGVTDNGNNTLKTEIEYSSSLTNPVVAVSLYRRDYSDIYSQEYTLVDLKDYVKDVLISTEREKEYRVTTSPNSTINHVLLLKTDLITGTYKLVYKLYDNDTYVGEAYEYVIIK